MQLQHQYPAVLAARPTRALFVIAAFAALAFAWTWSMSDPIANNNGPSTVPAVGGKYASDMAIRPDSNGLPGGQSAYYYGPYRELTGFEPVGNALALLGLLAVAGGAVAVGVNKLGGYLVTAGGAVLGSWGLWLRESDKALNGAAMGISVCINALILALILEVIEKATGRSLLGRRTIQISLVVGSVLIQSVIAAALFQTDGSNYSAYPTALFNCPTC